MEEKNSRMQSQKKGFIRVSDVFTMVTKTFLDIFSGTYSSLKQ